MSTYSNGLQPALQNLLQRVVRFFHPRSSCTTHISADVQRITLNASCMTISDKRTKQLDIFCRVTGFTSNFLSFIVVELIRFFHGAIQLSLALLKMWPRNRICLAKCCPNAYLHEVTVHRQTENTDHPSQTDDSLSLQARGCRSHQTTPPVKHNAHF